MAPATSDDSEESAAADGPDTEDEDPGTEEDAAHLDDLPDGSGCAEVWEHLSEEEEAAASDGDGDSDETGT